MKQKIYFRNSITSSYFTVANRFANLLLERGKKNHAYRLLLDSLLVSDKLSSSAPLKAVYNQYQISQKKIGYLNLISNTISTWNREFVLANPSFSNKEQHSASRNPSCFYEQQYLTSNSPKFAPQITKSLGDLKKNHQTTHLHSQKYPQFSKKTNVISSQQKCLQVINNVKPNLETRKVRRGGTVYQVPSILPHARQEGIAIRWLIDAAMAKNGGSKKKNTFSERLREEFSSTLKKSSQSRQKRDQLHTLAAMNRSNIRYRWW